MIDFKCVEAICRALKKHYPKMQVNSYGYGNMMLYDNYHQYINKNEYVKAMIFKSGPYNNYNYDEKCFILLEDSKLLLSSFHFSSSSASSNISQSSKCLLSSIAS